MENIIQQIYLKFHHTQQVPDIGKFLNLINAKSMESSSIKSAGSAGIRRRA